MNPIRYSLLASLFALASSIHAAALQDFYITDCSLSCTSGAGGNQVFCNIVEVHQNEVIEIGFNLPVDPASLSANTFRLVNVDNGTSPTGSLRVSLFDPTRIVFEPDNAIPGALGFTFEPDQTYEIFIAGTGQGDFGPFIRSVAGDPNQARMLCSVITNQGLLPLIRSECITTPNSVGPGALMGASGEPSIVLNNLVLETTGLPSNTFGIYLIGQDAAFSPLGAGSLCLSGSLQRIGTTQASSNGESNLPLNLPLVGGGISIVTGETWRFQHVYRDSSPTGPVFSTSDALRVTFSF